MKSLGRTPCILRGCNHKGERRGREQTRKAVRRGWICGGMGVRWATSRRTHRSRLRWAKRVTQPHLGVWALGAASS